MASDAQLVPAAEIHWWRPNGNPLSKYTCTGNEWVFTSHAPSWYWLPSKYATPLRYAGSLAGTPATCRAYNDRPVA